MDPSRAKPKLEDKAVGPRTERPILDTALAPGLDPGLDPAFDRALDPISTRPMEVKDVLDHALAEAVLRVRNEPVSAADAFGAMRDSLQSTLDARMCGNLLKKLVATALSSWTPPTADSEAFAAVALRAGFSVVTYPAGKATGPAVVREIGYSTSLGAERPLLKSLCRSFVSDVVKPALQHLRKFPDADDATRAFAEHLPELLRTGSLEAPSTPKLPALPRFALDG